MNNINSPELTRAVVTDNTTKAGRAATHKSTDGKELPELKPAQTPSVPKQATAPVEQSASVEKAVAQLNDYVQSLQRDLRFTLDDELGRAVIKVIDRNSQEVIRQIPNETALQLARNLKDQQRQELELSQEQLSAAGASLGLINTRI